MRLPFSTCLSPLVILTGVRRQPNGVEGPQHSYLRENVSEFLSSDRECKGVWKAESLALLGTMVRVTSPRSCLIIAAKCSGPCKTQWRYGLS